MPSSKPTVDLKTLSMVWGSADRWRAKWIAENRERHRWQHKFEEMEKYFAKERNRADAFERDVSRLQRTCSDLRDLLRVALERTDLPLCGECRGSGKVRDEEMVGCRDWMQSREVVVECRECDGLGRVL